MPPDGTLERKVARGIKRLHRKNGVTPGAYGGELQGMLYAPIEVVECSPVHLQGRVIENDEGNEFEVFFKVQRNKGVINESLPVEYVEDD